jgi:hypothetical protein
MPESDQLLGLSGFASETSARWSSRVVVATATGAPHPGAPATPAKHAFPPLCLLSDICRKHAHLRFDPAVFQHKKRYIEVFITLNK